MHKFGYWCALIGLPSSAFSQSQFDLICSTESVRTQNDGSTEPEIKKTQLRFRIDSTQKLWCWDACPRVENMVSSDSTKFILKHRDELTMQGIARAYEEMRIDRQTGEIRWVSSFGGTRAPYDKVGYRFELAGNCKKTPFSGFPKRKF